jgi:hypothetical protein
VRSGRHHLSAFVVIRSQFNRPLSLPGLPASSPPGRRIEGRTVAIEYRWAEGRNERLAEIAAEFVRLKVDIIVTHSASPVIAAKQATAVIPIVFAVAADPLGTGLVASLARPGRNVTGLSSCEAARGYPRSNRVG